MKNHIEIKNSTNRFKNFLYNFSLENESFPFCGYSCYIFLTSNEVSFIKKN